MSGLRRFQLIEHSPSSFLPPKSLSLNPWFPIAIEDDFDIALDLLSPSLISGAFPDFSSPFEEFDAVTDLIQIERTPFYSSAKRVQRFGSERHHLQSLCDRVSAIELGFDRLLKEEAEKKKKKSRVGQRKYTWTAEIKNPEEDGLDRTYKWVAEVKDGKKKGSLDKSYKMIAQIKGKGEDSPVSRTYTFKTSTSDGGKSNASGKEKEKEKEKEKKKTLNDKQKKESAQSCARVIEIEDPSDNRAIIRTKAFAKMMEKKRGKRKDLSPQDAAMIIQYSFKAYLVRRSKALRALRELAIAKSKLKELKSYFNNFTYRKRVARDAEERQRFSEKIIVLLLTVDAIEEADMMVRASKKSMVEDLEAMLDAVDPQQQPPAAAGRSVSMRRRTFDMPDSFIRKDVADGVAQVMQMLESNDSESFDPCS
ncbi:unnamed protein product [Cuscuta epithymum]|uniref:BAG domain-containing protein n=1 Tax=Cuscuta epithymum TaxID=186058 RepID=A0AAV0C3J8_9ASTE|nr:unnamed protein product [Cuscuta epithymum]